MCAMINLKDNRRRILSTLPNLRNVTWERGLYRDSRVVDGGDTSFVVLSRSIKPPLGSRGGESPNETLFGLLVCMYR
jgi:hypothetical protein